eukprot:349243-Hanusia_phi.AAC.1
MRIGGAGAGAGAGAEAAVQRGGEESRGEEVADVEFFSLYAEISIARSQRQFASSPPTRTWC